MRKIVYCTSSLDLPGGREKILTMKANWLAAHGWEVFFVTTNQGDRKSFFKLSPEISTIDLGIQYRQIKITSLVSDFLHNRKCHRKHRQKLEGILRQISPDITVSTFLHELHFLYKMKDSSKKIVEIHNNRLFRIQESRMANRGWLSLIMASIVTCTDYFYVRRFDAFICLTHKDAPSWGNGKFLYVIANPITIPLLDKADTTVQRVIAVGRLDGQKRHDILIRCWSSIPLTIRTGWRLDIYGSGELKSELEDVISEMNVEDSVYIHEPVKNIAEEYKSCAIYCSTSQFEGFSLALCEAMSAGLPVVTFDHSCGPSDMILDESMGMLVPMGCEDLFVEKLELLMTNPELRNSMGSNARKSIYERYTMDIIMKKWLALFDSLLEK